jgi:hypothetical protein
LKKHLDKVEKEKELKELRNKFKMKGKVTTVLAAFKRGPGEFNLPFILGVQINEMMQVPVRCPFRTLLSPRSSAPLSC